MYEDPQQPNFSVDYLNQIAPKPQKKGLFGDPKRIYLVIAGALIVGLIVIIIGTIIGHKPNSLQQLAARLQSTEKIAGDAQKNIQSSQLRSFNSNLKIFLDNTNRDIAAPLTASGVKPTKLDKKIVASESGADLVAKLEDARLNAVYDRTYAREMAYRLETIMVLMKDVYTSTSSKSLKTFLQTAYQNLGPVQKQFADFNAADG